jgi:hypothetical protein
MKQVKGGYGGASATANCLDATVSCSGFSCSGQDQTSSTEGGCQCDDSSGETESEELCNS